jgi:RNA polymerase sigma-70 factor (ECF subfamily)
VEAQAAVSDAFREEWGRVVATLIRMTGDWDLAEDCAQDAFAQALRRWPADGIPRRPGAWLTSVARNRALDLLRRRATETTKLQETARLPTPTEPIDIHDDDSHIEDDRLRLIFTCCHPALALESRVALTLRTLAGLTTAEIARAFLVAEPTMAKRLVRAKRKIANAGIPYRVPPADRLAERTSGVLAVLYLLFNEGYSASAGADLMREKLCVEAIRLTRAVAHLLPGQPEVTGLLALMLLQHSRREARVDEEGNLVTLDRQARTRWDRAEIVEATQLLSEEVDPREAGPYGLQAMIAACHARADEPDATDWQEIAGLYGRLALLVPSPIVELNRAVAVAMVEGAGKGLELVQSLVTSSALDGYYLLHATRADLLRRLGRDREAAASYREALALAGADAERRFILGRLAEVGGERP